jgi:hypothetical protein
MRRAKMADSREVGIRFIVSSELGGLLKIYSRSGAASGIEVQLAIAGSMLNRAAPRGLVGIYIAEDARDISNVKAKQLIR